MEYLDSYLKLWAGLNYTNAFLQQELQRGRLDEVLADILRASKEIAFYQKLYQHTDDERTQLIARVQAQLEKLEQKIVQVYVNWFEQHQVVGNKAAYRNPQVIVVLGANQPTLSLRVQAASSTIKNHPHAVVVLSGGGFSPSNAEAVQMENILKSYSLPNRVLLEEDSMDTLGNALFSKLSLARTGMLTKAKHILVITSCFHALRAEHYFEIIFNQCAGQNKPRTQSTTKPFKLAVQGVRTAKDGQEELLSVHELSTEYQAETTLHLFPAHQTGKYLPDFNRLGRIDDEWVLLQLFRNHALYQNRYDLLRKYLGRHRG